jgi:hypothetical protein
MIWLILLACRRDVAPTDSDTDTGAVDTNVEKPQCILKENGQRLSITSALDGAQLFIAADLMAQGPQMPVAVVQGGFSGEQVPARNSSILNTGGGHVQVHVDLPGSDSAAASRDYYGADSRVSVAELLRYTASLREDDEGCLLSDRIQTRDELILVGLSNGGNLAVSTLVDSTLDLPPVDALVLWETPSSAPFALTEYHRPELGDCTLGATLRCEMDYSQLRWAAGQAYLDRNGSGDLDPDEPSWAGLNPSIGQLFSPEMRTLLGDGKGLASQADTVAFWERREAASLVTELAAAYPSLKTMIVAGTDDHVQDIEGSPHVMGLAMGFVRQGLWVRLNPDSVYSGLGVENDAQVPIGFDSTNVLLNGSTNIATVSGGVHEMVDRVSAQDWSTDLDERL